jgi:undecaprenyl-diphosphatase
LRIVQGIGRSLRDREIRSDDSDAKLGWLIVVATIPAGLLGLLLEGSLRDLFKSAESAAAFLIANGLLLYGAERLRRRPPRPDDWKGDSDVRIAKLSWRQAIGVGAAQAIALIPGFSRSGASMGGGLVFGLSNEDAARFSFLLATPIIGAAAVLKLPELVGKSGHVIGTAVVGAACAAVTAYVSVKFLLKFFETNTLTPFAIYCVAAGTLLTIGFALT